MSVPPTNDWMHEFFDGGTRWLNGPDWDAVAAESRYSSEATAAGQALRQVLPWERIAKAADRGDLHPAVRQHLLRGGASVLLEAGVVLARYPAVAKRMGKRLRGPQYADYLAELRVALLLSNSGAKLEYEPAAKGKKGPDWVATWPRFRAAVEVKHPNIGERAQTAFFVELAFLWALQRHLGDTSPTTGAWLTFLLDRSLIDRCALGSWIDRSKLDALGAKAAMELRHRLPVPTRDTNIDIEGVGSFEIRLGLDGPPRFQISGSGTPADEEHEIARIADMLEEAAAQLAGFAGARIAALHLGRDALIGNYAEEIWELLHSERWAENLDAVLLVGCLDDELNHRNVLIRKERGGGVRGPL